MPETAVKEKLSVEELSALYDRIYNIADRLFKKYSPCNIYIKNGKSSCFCYPKHKPNLCCNDCVHLGLFGCIAQCLACKLYMCPEISQNHPTMCKRLNRLRNITWRLGIPIRKYFTPKEKCLEHIKEKHENN